MKVLGLVLVMLLVCGVALAEVPGNPVKAGIAYNIDDNHSIEVIGGTVKSDIFAVKNLDYDILVGSEMGGTFTDDDKVFINQISYNYDINDKLGIFVGLGIGLERLEKLEAHRLGEHDKYATAGVSYSW